MMCSPATQALKTGSCTFHSGMPTHADIAMISQKALLLVLDGISAYFPARRAACQPMVDTLAHT